MQKIKIYGAIVCRVIILIVLFALLLPMFLVYVLCLVGEAYLSLVGAYVQGTRDAFIEYDKQLNNGTT